MKKFLNLSVILAVLVSAFAFTSCSDDDDSASITVTFNQSGKFETGETIVGTIVSAEESLEKVTVSLNGAAVKTYTSFKSSDEIQKVDNNGNYRIFITSLTAVGEYKLRAESKTGSREVSFSIVDPNAGGEDTPLSPAASFTLTYPGNSSAANGITYASNTNATTAKFNAQFVNLTEAQYNAITTVEALEDAFYEGTQEVQFTAQSNANFVAKYLIVDDNDTFRLVKMTGLTFAEGNNQATFTEKH